MPAKMLIVDEGSFRVDVARVFLKNFLSTLAQITLSVLVIPHSRADEERVFSIIGKNMAESRLQLDHFKLNCGNKLNPH